jgi:hypothetical protein
LVNELQASVENQDNFDLDEITDEDLEDIPMNPTLYNLKTLNSLLQRPDLLPPGIEVTAMQQDEYRYSMAGMSETLRVTTNPDYYDQHSSSIELWSPGNLLFPDVSEMDKKQVTDSLNAIFT